MALLSWIKPPALKEGDLIGVCAPAGPVDQALLDRGVAELRSLGFEVRLADGVLARTGFTAGPARGRLEDLRTLFSDEKVAGIVCARGGSGSGWLLPHLDASFLLARPKVFVGYSDITLLHLYLNRLGLTTFHGPMVAREFAEATYDRVGFLWAVTGRGRPFASQDLRVLRRGRAEGRLRGGCLSLLAAAAGTPWALDAAEDTILFLEDVDEPPYRVDRLLFQLRASAALGGVRGIVFGEMKGCTPSRSEDCSLADVILAALDGLDLPIAFGLPSGHAEAPCVTLPLGVRARLDCGEEARLEALEAAVA